MENLLTVPAFCSNDKMRVGSFLIATVASQEPPSRVPALTVAAVSRPSGAPKATQRQSESPRMHAVRRNERHCEFTACRSHGDGYRSLFTLGLQPVARNYAASPLVVNGASTPGIE